MAENGLKKKTLAEEILDILYGKEEEEEEESDKQNSGQSGGAAANEEQIAAEDDSDKDQIDQDAVKDINQAARERLQRHNDEVDVGLAILEAAKETEEGQNHQVESLLEASKERVEEFKRCRKPAGSQNVDAAPKMTTKFLKEVLFSIG